MTTEIKKGRRPQSAATALVIQSEVEESLLLSKGLTMSLKLSDKKLALIGAGKLGGILLRAYLKQGLFVSNRVTATVKHPERAAALAKELGISVTTDNRKAVNRADVILLTVKPQSVAEG